jgi:ParB family chromosome partitioning protein
MNIKQEDIHLVPVEQIRVLNPRTRDQRKFSIIMENIRVLGLKKPITVRQRKNGEDGYDLVCGQGRLEAFKKLGHKEIPAFIRGLSKNDALLCSLVENIARRNVRAIDQIKTIDWMEKQGQPRSEIAVKTGLSEQYVADVLMLLRHGEERLLDAALHGRIPITIATQIAGVSDEDAQKALMGAYESKELNQKNLRAFRKLVEQRRFFGRSADAADRGSRKRSRTSAAGLVQAYKRSVEKQRLFVRKARSCESRLLSMAAALRKLLSDEHFNTLLRAENLLTLPEFLDEMMQAEREVA